LHGTAIDLNCGNTRLTGCVPRQINSESDHSTMPYAARTKCATSPSNSPRPSVQPMTAST
jgi:hypothetical protein